MLLVKRRVQLVLPLFVFLSSCLGTSRPADEPAPTPTTTPTIFHLERSPFSYGIFETQATSLTIEVSNTVPGQFKNFRDISVEDGSGVTTYKVEDGNSTIVHSLPVGTKRVTVTSGMHTRFRIKIVGIFINKIIFNGPAVQIEPEGRRLLVYGDSLTVGGNVQHVSAEAWPVLLRKHFSVHVEAYGYRALYLDASDIHSRSEFASKISSWSPEYVWLAIGSNDFGFDLWSALDFGKAYAATLDEIHARLPQARVFAQSPIRRIDEDMQNSFGNDLEEYRQQISASCQARIDWCVFVDGTEPVFPQLNELDQDGLHLTTESSVKYAEAVLTILNK